MGLMTSILLFCLIVYAISSGVYPLQSWIVVLHPDLSSSCKTLRSCKSKKAKT